MSGEWTTEQVEEFRRRWDKAMASPGRHALRRSPPLSRRTRARLAVSRQRNRAALWRATWRLYRSGRGKR